jgi:hypothetical protein
MVDYAPFLFRAVRALDPNTSEQRAIVYGRARRTLVEKYNADDRTFDMRKEKEALEAAIRRVEADAISRAAPSLVNSAYEACDAPAEEYQEMPPLAGTRKRLQTAASAIGALVILLAGVAAYFYWPRTVPEVRNILRPRAVNVADQPAAVPSYVYMRQVVYYRTNYPVGTIVIDKSQTFLYVIRPRLAALRYTIAVAPECTALVGLYHVVQKEEWPGWSPPTHESSDSINERLKSPLGARSLDLNEGYRIHGVNAFPTTGQSAVKSCIGLINDDVIDLYDRTPLESRVVVLSD